jgi:hypothetical protein
MKKAVNQLRFLSVNAEKPLMKFSLIIRLSLFVMITSLILSCNKTEVLSTDSIKDYMPLVTGKYITYRVDSTVFTNFGRTTEVHKYQVKEVVDSMILDNLGQPTYRVYRYLRDSAGLQGWQSARTYFVTPLSNQVQVIDNDLRVIKMNMPIKNGFTWKGNKYLPNSPYSSLYSFSNDDNMGEWDFYYDGDSTSSFSYGGKNYSSVVSVEEDNESYNVPITDVNAYAAKTRSVERYSKTIGLIYREHTLWEYQPNTGGTGGPYKTGFGIVMWMIDHN